MIVDKGNYKLYQGDCLEVMDKLIKQGLKVDAIITDPPYGTTHCKWDNAIPFDKLWGMLNDLIKDNGAILLFGSEPFSSALRMSNIKNYRYDLKWKKNKPTNHINAKRQPMRYLEDITVFYKKQPTFNLELKEKPIVTTSTTKNSVFYDNIGTHTREVIYNSKFDLLEFKGDRNKLHPTQKPVDLLEYLIKTYTNEGELILDFTMGSGSTGVACMNTNREFMGIELDENYFNIAKERIKEAQINSG